MIKLLKPKVTVEQIHAEFDSAEDRLKKQADEILNTLSIPTESDIERKAKLAKELGFVNSEVVVKANAIRERNKKIQDSIEITRAQANDLNDLKFHYPNEKFLNVEELNRICEKYNLIYCPIENYIKDIPEKNLLEIKRAIPLSVFHSATDEIIYSFALTSDPYGTKQKAFKKVINFLGKSHFTDAECDDLLRKYDLSYGDTHYRSNLLYYLTSNRRFKEDAEVDELLFVDAKHTRISKTGLFIAAPESHFNTEGLSKKEKFGWFNVQVTEVKDPVVFEYCKNGFIRILTKWGTDDDQAYLDPALFNERLN
jgi:hypothetical protein